MYQTSLQKTENTEILFPRTWWSIQDRPCITCSSSSCCGANGVKNASSAFNAANATDGFPASRHSLKTDASGGRGREGRRRWRRRRRWAGKYGQRGQNKRRALRGGWRGAGMLWVRGYVRAPKKEGAGSGCHGAATYCRVSVLGGNVRTVFGLM